MNLKPVFYVNGLLLLVLAAAMMGPLCVDLSNDSLGWQVFAGAASVTAFIGLALVFMNAQKTFHVTLRETCLLATSGWVFIAAFAALPFCFGETKLDYTHAFFEAMSGITTTGTTAITGLDHLSHGLLLWRAMLHWLGGIGFLVLSLSILPRLQVSGMQIFKTQQVYIERVTPGTGQLAVYISMIYALFTFLCATLLNAAGMTPFEALCHAMSAISTGGFSTSDASITHFNSPLIDMVLVVFMLLGSLPFVLYLRMVRGDMTAPLRDSQVRTFLSCVLGFSLAMTVYRIVMDQESPLAALRQSLFAITSLFTTSGFIGGGPRTWGPFAGGAGFILALLGGCAGSAAGGIKIFRLQVLWLTLQQQIRQITMPHGLFKVRYNGKVVEPAIQSAVAVFFFVYILSWLIAGLVLQVTGLDFVNAYMGALSALSNTGPSLGAALAPGTGVMGADSAPAWIMSGLMLLGRLEFMTFLVLLTPAFWRD